MVRVGGGWDTLQNYLDKHDPCRCRKGHRSTIGAHMSVRGSKSPMAIGVTYDRYGERQRKRSNRHVER